MLNPPPPKKKNPRIPTNQGFKVKLLSVEVNVILLHSNKIDYLELEGTHKDHGMAAVPIGALSGQVLRLWWMQWWERTGSSASGNHFSLVELAELQCPSCQLVLAIPKRILLRQGRRVCTWHFSWPCPGSLSHCGSFCCCEVSLHVPHAGVLLLMELAWKLLTSSLPRSSNSHKMLVCLGFLSPHLQYLLET